MEKKRYPRKANSFGGMVISFEGRTETVESVMGEKNMLPGTMIKILWEFARVHGLISKSRPYESRRLRKSDLGSAMVEPDVREDKPL